MKTVIEMAREAELIANEGYQGTGWFWGQDNLERFAELVRADEREACAKVCDVLAVHPEYASEVTKLAASAIRARTSS